MKALIDSNGDCFAIVFSEEGYDLTGVTVVDPVPEPERDYVWDKATQAFIPRPPTPSEATSAALEADTRWQAMKTASPEQIETWLTNNVNSLADARRVLKILVLAVQKLARTRA